MFLANLLDYCLQQLEPGLQFFFEIKDGHHPVLSLFPIHSDCVGNMELYCIEQVS